MPTLLAIRKKMIAELIAIVKKPAATPQEREVKGDAIRALGQLRAPEAVPVLIDEIEFRHSYEITLDEITIDQLFRCVPALRAIGKPGSLAALAALEKRVWSHEPDRPHITDDNCVAFGKKADFFYLAGHGKTAYPGVAGDNGDHPLGDKDVKADGRRFIPDDIGTEWNNGECEWVVFAACSQLYIADLGSPKNSDNSIAWIKAMPKVHGLFGYAEAAPINPPDENIAKEFALNTKIMTIVDAWMEANLDEGAPGYNAAAIVRVQCTPDQWKTASAFPTPDGTGTTYKFYWIDQYDPGGPKIKVNTITLP